VVGDGVHQRGRQAGPFHQADLHRWQGREAVRGGQNLHAGAQRRFRQYGDSHARQHGGGDHGGRPACEQNLIIPAVGIKRRAGKLAPVTIASPDRQRHGRIVLQRMVGGGDPAERLCAHDIRGAGAGIMGDERDIQFAPRHFFGKPHRWFADDVKLDIRMRLGKTADDFRHVAVGIVVRRADAQRALEPVVVKGGDRLVVEANDAAGVIHQFFALRRQAVATSVLGEKLFTDALFKPPHLHGNGGLRLENAVCGLGKTTRIDDGDEGVQLVYVERCGHGWSSIRMIDVLH